MFIPTQTEVQFFVFIQTFKLQVRFAALDPVYLVGTAALYMKKVSGLGLQSSVPEVGLNFRELKDLTDPPNVQTSCRTTGGPVGTTFRLKDVRLPLFTWKNVASLYEIFRLFLWHTFKEHLMVLRSNRTHLETWTKLPSTCFAGHRLILCTLPYSLRPWTSLYFVQELCNDD